jgi:DNA-binding beta-propeller fold protein YncE
MMAYLARMPALLVVLIGLTVSGGCGAQVRTDAPLATASDRLFSLAGDFPLGQGTNRADYQSFDPTSGRLYIAKMGAGKLLVFDTTQNKLIAERDGFPKVTGVLAVPELHRIYASVPGAGLVPSIFVGLGMAGLSSGRGAIAILDTTDLHEIARLPGGVFPDGIAYDPKERRIFVSDELGSAVLVIDADTNRMVARIDAGGEVGNVRYDPVTAKIYAPIQTRGELLVIDPVNNAVVTRLALPGGKHPHGLAIAPSAAIGYIACDGDDKLLTVDLVSGKMLDRMPLGHDPDVLAIDPDQRRLYVASESGNLSSFDITTERAPASLGDVFVGENAHSVALNPKSHRLYFPLADVKGRMTLRVLAPKQ